MVVMTVQYLLQNLVALAAVSAGERPREAVDTILQRTAASALQIENKA
jgi:hypothetical protein